MHVLKTGSCPSLSGKSTLTYHIAHKEKEVYFCLAENTKSGVLSKEWISLQQMEALLATEECTFTSRTSALHTLYKGHSINSGGFLLAVLLKEGLVNYAKGKRRSYCLGDSSVFYAAIHALMGKHQASPPVFAGKDRREEEVSCSP
ncbi:hypothetical protein [Desulfocastanea catecholica]